MARTRKTSPKNVIEHAVNMFDDTVKRYLETIPKQIQDAEIEPPGGRRKQPPPRPRNPFGGI
jgi:hypothetical protein